jgi:hypothetical protein
MLLRQLHPAVVDSVKLEVALPLLLGSLSRGVLGLGDLQGARAPTLEVDHLRFPQEMASGIGGQIFFAICFATSL